jgi:AraC-like DNA-binding protein
MEDREEYPKIYLYRRIVQAKLFIDQHYRESIDLDNIADRAFLSKFYFLRLFKSAYGKTPHQYLTSVRIEKAKLLLEDGMQISEVCFELGFDSVSSFTGLFKKIVSLTPSEFQRGRLKRNTEIQTVPLKYVPNCFAKQYGCT